MRKWRRDFIAKMVLCQDLRFGDVAGLGVCLEDGMDGWMGDGCAKQATVLVPLRHRRGRLTVPHGLRVAKILFPQRFLDVGLSLFVSLATVGYMSQGYTATVSTEGG